MAVAVGVLEELHAAAGRSVAVDAKRIIAHFDDPQLAVRPPFKGDGVLDQRFRRHQLHREAGADVHRF